MHIPHQKDIVYINFDPSTGREIRKRRPAVVISSYHSNRVTGFVGVVPITSTIRSQPIFVDLSNQKVKGQIVANQYHSFDFRSRDIQYIDKLADETFYKVEQIISQILNFNI